MALVALGIIGMLAGGLPAGADLAGWAAGGIVLGVTLAVLYAALLRFDLTQVPIAIGTMAVVTTLARGGQRAHPGALAGSMLAAVMVSAIAWWWFDALRRARAAVEGNEPHAQVEALRAR
jgi:hypothetical protein